MRFRSQFISEMSFSCLSVIKLPSWPIAINLQEHPKPGAVVTECRTKQKFWKENLFLCDYIVRNLFKNKHNKEVSLKIVCQELVGRIDRNSVEVKKHEP